MKNFVLAYVSPTLVAFSDVLLLPNFLMPGGEIADDEMPEVAAARFLKEAGLTASLPDIRVMGVIQHKNELVHVCHCPIQVNGKEDLDLIGDAFWSPLNEVMKQGSPVPHSVRLSVALCRAGLTNWAFTNDGAIVGLNLEGWQ